VEPWFPQQNSLFFPTQTPDTIFYDDGTGVAYYNAVDWSFAVRFTPIIPCSLRGAAIANYQSAADSCTLFVWTDSNGVPGHLVHAPIPYEASSFLFKQVDLDSTRYFDTDFWLGYQAPGPPFCLMDAAANSPIRSFWSYDRVSWVAINAGDLLVRALVDYGGVKIRDVAVKSVNASGGFFMRNPAYSIPSAIVQNTGDTTESSFPVECIITDTTYALSIVYADTQYASQIVPGKRDTLVFKAWTPNVDGEYIIKVTSLLNGDMVADNDVKYLESQVCSPPRVPLTYDDNEFDGSFTGAAGNAWGTQFTPPWYPCLIESVKIYFGMSGTPVVMWVMDDTGPWHSPGIAWYAETTSVSTSGWYTFNTYLKAPVFDKGSFFIVYWWNDGAASLAYDSDLPIASQSWRFQGSWARESSNDWMMRAYISMVEKHDAAVSDITSPPDTVISDSIYDVSAMIANVGNMTDTIKAFCMIDAYADTITLPDVGYGQTTEGFFKQWTVPHSDTLARATMTVFVLLRNDNYPLNDTLKKTIVYGPPKGVTESLFRHAHALLFLGHNSPNPFSGRTTIPVGLPKGISSPSIGIYDISGRLVRTLSPKSDAETTTLIWDGRTNSGDLAESGVYFCRLSCGGFVQTRNMVMIR
jgi:hypothetical protein